mgnify:CR=1 FL=1
MTQVAEARRFFATMAKKYKETAKISFMRYAMSQMAATGRLSSDMRPKVIKVIRKYDKKAIVVVGNADMVPARFGWHTQ